MFNTWSTFGDLGADGCPQGYWRHGMPDIRYPCEPDPNYKAPEPAQVQEPINPFNVGWCAPGYYRPCGNCQCVVDPYWRPPTTQAGDYVTVGGTMIRKSELNLPTATSSAGGGGSIASMAGGLGLDTSTLMMLGLGLVAVVMLKKR